MASKTLGRTSCPLACGHTAAHVKIKTDKPTEAFPYIHCRGCGAQLHTKNQEQARYLLANTRPEALDAPQPDPAPVPADPPAPPAPPAPAPPPAAKRGIFGRHA